MMAAPLPRPAAQGHTAAAPAKIISLVVKRIERALATRTRYRYVRPVVEPQGDGWRIVCPNCSRTVDPSGGPIPIVWLRPEGRRLWLMHAWSDAGQCWQARPPALPLDQALTLLCADPNREFWR